MSEHQQAKVVSYFAHNDRAWRVVRIKAAYYARDELDSDTGPFRTIKEAVAWVRAIVPTKPSDNRPETAA